jgi:thiol-disulfide isomerase/thioredoxin
MFHKSGYDRRRFIIAAAMTTASLSLGLPFLYHVNTDATPPLNGVGLPEPLSSLAKANTWLNATQPTAEYLQGKVILVDFGTYTCINWLRTLPYVRAWADTYKDSGLVVIGVNTPEFLFEERHDYVRQAIESMQIHYPVVIDNDRAIWDAFNNQYWPALYLLDAKGHIRHTQFGEGGYLETEEMIRKLLPKSAAGTLGAPLALVNASGIEAAADWLHVKSRENYLGYERTLNFASPGGSLPDRRAVYTAPAKLALNEWALTGDWTMGKQSVILNKANGRIKYLFHARDLHLVMGATAPAAAVRFRIYIDGNRPGPAHGVDTDEEGFGTLTQPRLYQLVRQPPPIASRLFEVEFLDPLADLYSFTFG